MENKKERVYSEEDLCEYTILQKIDALEKQLQAVKTEASTLYELKTDADKDHTDLTNDIGTVDDNLLEFQNNVVDNYETKTEANSTHTKLQNNINATNKTVESLNKAIPTDVGIKDNKLGLLHDTTWLTNQGAINLDGFTYDEATNTLKASGGEGLPVITASLNSERQISLPTDTPDNFLLYVDTLHMTFFMVKTSLYYGSVVEANASSITIFSLVSSENDIRLLNLASVNFNPNDIPDISISQDNLINVVFNYGVDNINFTDVKKTKILYILDTSSSVNNYYPLYYISESEYKGIGVRMYNNMTILENYTLTITNNIGTITTITSGFKHISLFGNHSILVPKDSADSNINLYTHYITLDQGGESYLYLTIVSSSNLIVDSLTDLNTLLGTTKRSIHCSGTMLFESTYLDISCIDWQGSVSTSNVNYTDAANGEDFQTMSSMFGSPTVKDVVITI